MAAKTFVGTVGQEGTATGPHLHYYVKDLRTGQLIDPRTYQSPLLDIRVGQGEVPLAIKDAQGKITLNPAAGATVTSEFGRRTAPTAGASTEHGGRDIALPLGTPVKYFGSGDYTAQSGVQGFGNLGKITTPDKRYELGFGHLASLGASTAAPGGRTVNDSATWNSAYETSQQRTKDLLEAFMYGTQVGSGGFQVAKEQKPQTLLESLKSQLLKSIAPSVPGSTFSELDAINQQIASSVYG